MGLQHARERSNKSLHAFPDRKEANEENHIRVWRRPRNRRDARSEGVVWPSHFVPLSIFPLVVVDRVVVTLIEALWKM